MTRLLQIVFVLFALLPAAALADADRALAELETLARAGLCGEVREAPPEAAPWTDAWWRGTRCASDAIDRLRTSLPDRTRAELWRRIGLAGESEHDARQAARAYRLALLFEDRADVRAALARVEAPEGAVQAEPSCFLIPGGTLDARDPEVLAMLKTGEALRQDGALAPLELAIAVKSGTWSCEVLGGGTLERVEARLEPVALGDEGARGLAIWWRGESGGAIATERRGLQVWALGPPRLLLDLPTGLELADRTFCDDGGCAGGALRACALDVSFAADALAIGAETETAEGPSPEPDADDWRCRVEASVEAPADEEGEAVPLALSPRTLVFRDGAFVRRQTALVSSP